MTINIELLNELATVSSTQVCGQITVRGFSIPIENWLRFRLSNSSARAIRVAPDVTCCVAFGNDHPYLSQALSSIAAQNMLPAKILVGIDNSSGLSEETQNDLVDIHHFRGRNGPFFIMDSLIRMADSKYILIMDSDDISHPDRLELLLNCAVEGEAEVVGSAVGNFEEYDEKISTLGVFPRDPYEALANGLCHAMLYPTILIRRSAYLDIGGFSDFDFFGMDTDFIVRLAHRRRGVNLPLPLYAKRRRTMSLTECRSTGMESDRRANILEYTSTRHRALFSG
ncbi:glycosyl transferase family 2 [Paraburkholderia sp. BL18I3N2]|uniref:glycosyltransferase family 2 protein n=1 Tax=Paraburkholderia sp. BL18I3N2 TaxID=1938799 RepID=UPI000D062C3A|nr:glycosyltransferase family A protein [Paraburkholderia sp. BL18I3N2]PRX19166.1 glycosyl transferase family 2 [Paraburkholderia sp. BL18I3N2]